MPYIRPNPRKTKPSWLDEPCKSCEFYEETEAELHPTRKAIWGTPGMRQHFNRCRYDPRFCDPDLCGKCPFSELVGKPLIAIVCDSCGKIIKCLSPNDEELAKRLASKKDDLVSHFDLCDACKKKNNEPTTLSQRGK